MKRLSDKEIIYKALFYYDRTKLAELDPESQKRFWLLCDEYSASVNEIRQKKEERLAAKSFRKLKKLLNADDYKTLINGFYFNEEAVRYLEKADLSFHLNEYYDLGIDDILLMTDEAENLEEVKKKLYEDYQPYYAESWYENYISVLKVLNEKKGR